MIGIDIVKIERLADKINNTTFLNGVFTANELDYYNSTGKRLETLAGFFACKEAIAKALGTGFSGFKLTDIEITHTDKGAPIATLYGNAKKLSRGNQINISISHEERLATAVAIIKD